MLLRNESKVKHSIEVKLVFDDNTTRELEINVGDMVEVSYRKNGCRTFGKGVIREICPYIKKWCHHHPDVSACILLDMSEDHRACVERIDLCDIIDIQFVYNCGCEQDCPCHVKPEQPEPQCCPKCPYKEPSTDTPCLDESDDTDKEVVDNG